MFFASIGVFLTWRIAPLGGNLMRVVQKRPLTNSEISELLALSAEDAELVVNPRFPPTILVPLTTSQVLRRPPEVT
jgi:hypothetical protein